MPDQSQPGQAPGEPQPTPPQTPPASDPPGQESDEFDRERAMATIARLREFEKKAKTQERELESLKAKQKEREEAELGELERSKRRVAELEEAAKQSQAERRELRTRMAIEREAGRLGFRKVEYAHRLIDQDALEYDDEGTPSNVKELLEALAKDDPLLLAQSEQSDTPARPRALPSTPQAARQAAPADLVAQAEKQLRGTGRYRPLG